MKQPSRGTSGPLHFGLQLSETTQDSNKSIQQSFEYGIGFAK